MRKSFPYNAAVCLFVAHSKRSLKLLLTFEISRMKAQNKTTVHTDMHVNTHMAIFHLSASLNTQPCVKAAQSWPNTHHIHTHTHTHTHRWREFYNTDFCRSYRTIAGLCLYCWVKSCLVRLCILFPLSLMVTSTTGARTGPHVKHIRPAVRPVWRKENRLVFHIKRSYNVAPRLQFKHCAQVNAYSWLKEARKLTSGFYAS